MAATRACQFLAGSSVMSTSGNSGRDRGVSLSRRMAVSTEQISSAATTTTSFVENGRLSEKKTKRRKEESELISNVYWNLDEMTEENRKKLKDYFEECKDLIRSDGGPPRWFSPLECGSHTPDSPLLLFLPGIDGTGLGLIRHHHKLGKIFDLWCLHIPAKDRTSFAATSFNRSQLQSLIPLLELIPDQLLLNLPYMLNLVSGDPLRMAWENVVKGLLPLQNVGVISSQDLLGMPQVLADMLPRETLLWKLQLLKSASASANSHLHAVKVQALILCSGKDQLLPSQEEVQRLRRMLPKSEIRLFEESGHFLFLEDDVDLVTSIKGASFYRRGKYLDYVSDYIPPTPYEFKKIYESNRWVVAATSPVMLSTLEDGEVVRGLAGIPSEGPVLYVGYHMLLGFELAPMVIQFFMERNILLRGIAHPMMFFRLREGNMVDLAAFDTFRLMGAVPVSGPNFYKLLSSKSHVLLYPGGVREALHRKGEEYKLFWPERSEFVRMASRFGTKIVPFGVVGEDDVGELVFDYNDQMHIPPLRSFIKELTEESVQLRTDANGEVSNQDVHLPGVLPKLPGRFYYYFGKPIETEGRKQELRNSEISQELYLHVKSEVERCMAYLKEKREKDPYRNLLPRLLYRATHGFTAEVPTFEL
ncbi:Esterase/lipase/thioesterase family protein isoform 3 [Theobroma cacao]|uniref:Esterase/lipase/thioesterase family protein isoform 3 n=1 Tax=Theobroma cacao TaxID=3641 RepID=A0A061EKR3_THECC|nr:Esterase/lipase/thioesterase family protein isoform 3 [Theobroma cacao]